MYEAERNNENNEFPRGEKSGPDIKSQLKCSRKSEMRPLAFPSSLRGTFCAAFLKIRNCRTNVFITREFTTRLIKV